MRAVTAEGAVLRRHFCCALDREAPLALYSSSREGDMAYPFKNLIFEGGGVKGVAYVGALEVLDERGILPQVQRVGGASAGAITATLLALGMTSQALRELMLKLDFNQFKDGNFLGDVERLFSKYGRYKGDSFLEFIETQIAQFTGSRNTTFEEMRSRGFRELYVIGTDLSTHEYQVFSWEQTGNVRVADAVRISMSIPLYFASMEHDGDSFVDGGVLNNYPITLFDNTRYLVEAEDRTLDCPNAETLGFHLGKHVLRRREIKNIEDYVVYLFETILDVQDDALWNDEASLRRTVSIDNLGIGTTDFDITIEQKEALIKQGREATTSYLEAHAQGLAPVTHIRPKKSRRRSA
jgi:NTE family protein